MRLLSLCALAMTACGGSDDDATRRAQSADDLDGGSLGAAERDATVGVGGVTGAGGTVTSDGAGGREQEPGAPDAYASDADTVTAGTGGAPVATGGQPATGGRPAAGGNISTGGTGGTGGANGGSAGAGGLPSCPPGEKYCGTCMAPSPDNGCFESSCAPCPYPLTQSGDFDPNGMPVCSSGVCAFGCYSGWHRELRLEGEICVGNNGVPDQCFNATKDADEGDVDCGGVCRPCANGRSCSANSQCESLRCDAGTCTAATCSDGLRDGRETGTDCGYMDCGPCPAGETCEAARDCLSAVCTAGVCRPSCIDGFRNASETDVDCGGPECPPCVPDAACSVAADCSSGVCASFVCAAPTCSDALQNGLETAVDCGGAYANGPCPGCPEGAPCVDEPDCAGGNCAPDHICRPAHCENQSAGGPFKDGDETDANCGGSCAPCWLGASCLIATDCASGTCSGNVCITP